MYQKSNMLQILMILLFTCCLDLLSARPADEPTRFTLNSTESNAENVLQPGLEEAKELLGRVVDAIRIGRGRFVNSIILARNIIANKAINTKEQLTSETQNNVDPIVGKSNNFNQSRRSLIPTESTTPVVLFLPMTRETVRLENETAQSFFEKRKPDNIGQFLNSILNPVPIVDKIKEEEKYGNTGDKFSGIGRAIVNGYENFSNFLNAVVELPVNAAKQTSRGITQILNEIGARIVGLQ